jgi:hypothetical protein
MPIAGRAQILKTSQEDQQKRMPPSVVTGFPTLPVNAQHTPTSLQAVGFIDWVLIPGASEPKQV